MEVGGTHPALLEAMGYGNCVLTLETPENAETIGEAGLTYNDAQDLMEKLQRLVLDGAMIGDYRRRAQVRIGERYNWESVVDQYENLFAQMAELPLPQSGLS